MYSILSILVVLVPILIAVAFSTVVERKIIGSMQRRVGPDTVGAFGILQPFADALKLIVKEQIIPSQATKSIFILAPVLSLIFSLLGWAVIPFGPGLAIYDFSLGLIYSLAFSSLGVFGVLLAGWSAYSKYSFLGSLRSSAQMISYELIFSSCVLALLFITGSLSYSKIVFLQQSVWYILPFFPIFILFLISILAETNRTPFDLPEAESELVGGYLTDKSSTVFVIFYLSEYSSIVIISTMTSLLFLGGYNLTELFINNSFINFVSIGLGIKACLIVFFFVWARATLPRMRFDQLITFCWLKLLPFCIAFLIFIPALVISLDFAA